MKVQEAFRTSDESGKLSSPVPFNEDVEPVVVPANDSVDISIESCTDLLVGIVLVEERQTAKGITITTTTRTTCYGPYGGYDSINDDWGLVIHKPYRYGDYRDYLNKDLDYGIKCLSPRWVGQVEPLGVLPAQLK